MVPHPAWPPINSKRKIRIPPPPTENFTIDPPVPCPCCPFKGSHHYKLHWGLLRHMIREHYVNSSHQSIGWEQKERVQYLRKFLIRYSKYVDIPVKSHEQVELWIYHYCIGWNPSMRAFE